MTRPERVEKLMVLLAVGFCWAHKIGEWRATIKPIVLNQHRASQRPPCSYFRYDFDLIRAVILQFASYFQHIKQYLKQIFWATRAQQD